jgi:hypothetical protein
MTTPVLHDQPDWQRTVSAADIQVLNFSGAQGVAQVDRGTFFVGNLPFLWLFASTTAGGVRVTLDWLDAATGGTVIAQNRADARFIASASGAFRVLGPYVRITTDVDAPPRTIALRMWQALTGGQEVTPDTHNSLITQDSVPIPGATLQSVDAIRVRWGWGYFFLQMHGGVAFWLKLLARDYAGNTFFLTQIRDLNTYAQGPILLPPMPVWVEAFNADAAAHNWTASVLMHPGPF